MDGIGRNAGPRCAGERTQRAAAVLTKLPEAEPDMPKMYRHGGFSLFLSLVRAVFSEMVFARARHKFAAIPPYGKNFNAVRAESSR